MIKKVALLILIPCFIQASVPQHARHTSEPVPKKEMMHFTFAAHHSRERNQSKNFLPPANNDVAAARKNISAPLTPPVVPTVLVVQIAPPTPHVEPGFVPSQSDASTRHENAPNNHLLAVPEVADPFGPVVRAEVE